MALRGTLQRPESPGERFLREFSRTGQIAHDLGKEFRGEAQQKSERGEDLARRKIEREEDFAHSLKLQEAKHKTEKLEEKRRGYEVGLGTIEAMKPLIDKLGADPITLAAGFIPGTPTAAAIKEYKTYANSLLGILTTIPVRNQKEFESVKESLSSPRSSQAEMRQSLHAAEDIIRRHLDSLGGSSEFSGSMAAGMPEEEIPEEKMLDFSSLNDEEKELFEKKAKQLFKKYGDREKVRKILKREYKGLDVK